MLRRTILLVAVAAVSVITGCRRQKESASAAEMTVDVAPVMQDSIMIRNTYPGILTAASKADVVARVNGRQTELIAIS